ncbi:MAG: pseudouridine-5-phosphate glycosidase [Candidatus Lumbricidophila eiseniae]|uniref:Pseudouridine-5'-phosphate glycosidase n=1 Tax=Candidatus Lumbricidiphila eiseniae TaxID=1969409 RepID=A0A2A6FV31_9MICO|nr:MAG: pseudouridine-5-phosphate glycosidase [Candidatus Lumbricidophila eiseniae]
MAPVVRISDEVQAAIAGGRPVVALESTIFTHGLPRPRNFEVATRAEDMLRASGVVPATIGVLEGEAVIGLSTKEIQHLSLVDTSVKVSIRDLPTVIAKGLNAGTTVAATAYLASRTGIRVFSTGGLGGVHKNAQHTFDESADLTTLASLDMVVISAGVKSILDIKLTLERLETLSLGIVGYGTTNYPGFYLTDSGLDIDFSVSSPEEVATIVAVRDTLGIRSTLLVANPLPQDQQLPPEVINAVIKKAQDDAEAAGIAGHDTTPFLLDSIHKETNGRSIEVNLTLYYNNVKLGGQIATVLSNFDKK